MNGIDIPEDWERAADAILKNESKKILVLGAVDTGKSTFCTFLSHCILESGADVAFVDADIGQKDLGPPATITLGYPLLSLDLAAIQPERFYFVGSVTPARHFLPMVVGTQSLVTSVSGAAFTIVNTTGLIRGIGRTLKSFKIEAIKPDLIIAMEKAHELRSIIRNYQNHNIIRLKPSQAAQPKTPEQRRLSRENAYAQYFANASKVTLKTRKLVFQRTLLFSGKRIQIPNFTHVERTSEGTIGIPSHENSRYPDIEMIHPGFEQDLLCSIGNSKNEILGLATVQQIDFLKENISLYTPVAPESIRVIQLGDVYVARDGRELRRKKPESI